MITLNLIPKQLKEEAKLKKIYELIKRLNYILIILTIIIAIIFLFARLVSQNNFNKIIAQTTLVTKKNQSYNTKVRETNSKIDFILKIQKDFIVWSNLIDFLAQNTPNDITLSLIGIDKESKQLTIRGFSYSRNSLLKLRDNIETSTIFQDLNFPVKNILEKENINFDLEATINTNQLMISD